MATRLAENSHKPCAKQRGAEQGFTFRDPAESAISVHTDSASCDVDFKALQRPRFMSATDSAAPNRPIPLPVPQDWAALGYPAHGANALRFLAMDAVQKANAGHPGMPMGMADVATVLWNGFLQHNPANPSWFNRDRFVLSAGHGSMLLYGLLHLSGYDLPMSELQQFRQMGSKTPGHPEYGHTPGVEITTGPLGQGISSAVGFALAERWLAARFNLPEHDVVDHLTYTICSDGDLEEGISHEACSLAGHLRLGRLIALYDDNSISIDGPTKLSFSEDVTARFAAYGWHVQRIDGHNPPAIRQALADAQTRARTPGAPPTLIACKTIIGYGAPTKAGTESTHGSPLGEAEIAGTRKALGWDWAPFVIPEPVQTFWRKNLERGAAAEKAWQVKYDAYAKAVPREAGELKRIASRIPHAAWEGPMNGLREKLRTDQTADATRAWSGKVLETLVPANPDIVGGSADLTPSNNTRVKTMQDIAPGSYGGRYVRYGVREHGMGAILNGLALHGGVVPYSGTFLVFSDYMRGAIRLAALSGLQVIYVFTHDSIGVGEDGPTHQPVEHYAALRAIPNLRVWRPADGRETLEAWESALRYTKGPSALLLSRQKLPALPNSGPSAAQGGYILSPVPDGLSGQVLLMGTGSETHLALKAQSVLAEAKIGAQVVSLPCWEAFRAQPQYYQDQVLPPAIGVRVAVEAGVHFGWAEWIGIQGGFVGMTTYGASAPYEKIYAQRGITVEAVVEQAKKRVK
jgi:transketolase